jgi:ADP-ribosylation factor-binding protein GGA
MIFFFFLTNAMETQGYTLKLDPQSGRSLGPSQQNGITQTIRVQGVERGAGKSVKLRWRASYSLAGQVVNEQGAIEGLGVA